MGRKQARDITCNKVLRFPVPPLRSTIASSSTTLTLTIKSLRPPAQYSLAVHPTNSIAYPAAPPADTQRLLLMGKALADNKLVREYIVKDGDTLNLLDDFSLSIDLKGSPSLSPGAGVTAGRPPSASPSVEAPPGDLPSSSSSSSPSTRSHQNSTTRDITLTLHNVTPALAEQELSTYHAGIANPQFWHRRRAKPPLRSSSASYHPARKSHHPLDLPRPLASTDASKPSLKRKLEDDEAAEPKELEHPHRLVRGSQTPRHPAAVRAPSPCTPPPLYPRPPCCSPLRVVIDGSTRPLDAAPTPRDTPERTRSPNPLPLTTTDTLHSQIPTLQISRHNSPAHRRRLRASPPHPHSYQQRYSLPPPCDYSLTYAAASIRMLWALEAKSKLDAHKLGGLKALLLLYMQAAAFISFVGVPRPTPEQSPPRMAITSSPITLPVSLDALLALLPGPFASASSSSSGSSPGRHRRSVDEPPAPRVRLARARGSRGPRGSDEACERWLERAAGSVSAGMVIRLHFLLAVLTHYAHKLRSAPSTPAPHYEGTAPIMTLPDPRAVHFHAHPHPLLPRAPLAQRRRSVHHGEKEEGSTEGATDVWASATRPSGAYAACAGGAGRLPVHARRPGIATAGTCARGARAGREGKARRADARLLPAGVVHVKREWL
ncbi:hypothetical protein C8J57DRAFT_1730415 [Mycena rebaudengoi]|nr:hypothetical protein C8J57DRAFT_1730415 [Mycena rebaudengoi]